MYVILILTIEAKKLIEVNKIELLFGKHNNIFIIVQKFGMTTHFMEYITI